MPASTEDWDGEGEDEDDDLSVAVGGGKDMEGTWTWRPHTLKDSRPSGFGCKLCCSIMFHR